jgi:outer membrane protein assembly factor BamA
MADFRPSLELELDKTKIRDKPLDWNIDDIYISGGIASDGTVLSYSFVNLSDLLNDHFLQVYFSTINTFGNFGVTYLNQTGRWIWGAAFYREKRFFLTTPIYDFESLPEGVDELTISAYGGSGVLAYPFDKFRRVTFTLGFARREYSQGFLDTFFPDVPEDILENFKSGNYIPMTVSFVGDTTRFQYYGPFAGRRYRVDFTYAPNFGDSTLGFQNLEGDFRNYLQLTRDSLLAVRFFGAYSGGEAPAVYYFGGTDTMRGYGYQSFSGSRAFFLNTELRFPLVDALKFPKIPAFRLRGLLFFDLGAAWYQNQDFRFFEEGEFRLATPAASFGFGFSLNLGYFDLNWSFSKLTDLKDVSGGLEVDFHIGQKF